MTTWSMTSSNVAVTTALLMVVLSVVMASIQAADVPRVPNVRPVRRHLINRRDTSRLEDLPPEIRALITSDSANPTHSEPVGDPNCFVEIDVPKHVGGQCHHMPGRVPVCSVNDMLYVNHPDCS